MTLLALLPLLAHAEPSAHTTASGAHVAVAPIEFSSEVSVAFSIEIGSSSVPSELPQQAHLIEHLFYRGHAAEGRAREDLLRIHDCERDSETDWAHTEFRIRCPAADTEWLVAMVVDALDEPLRGIGQPEVDIQHSLLWQEYYDTHTSSERAAHSHRAAALAADHPAAREQPAPSPRPPSLEALRESVRQWTPQHLSLAVVGAVDAEQVFRQLEPSLGAPGPYEAKSTAPAAVSLQPARDPQLRSASGYASSRLLRLAWPVTAGHSEASALASFIGGRLDGQLGGYSHFLGVHCAAHPVDPQLSVLSCEVRTSSADVSTILNAVRRGLDRIRESKLEGALRASDEARAALQDVRQTFRTEDAAALLLGELRSGSTVTLASTPLARDETLASLRQELRLSNAAVQWFVLEQPAEPELRPEAYPEPLPRQVPTTRASLPEVVLNEPEIASELLDNGMRLVAVQRQGPAQLHVSVYFEGGYGSAPVGLAPTLAGLRPGTYVPTSWFMVEPRFWSTHFGVSLHEQSQSLAGLSAGIRDVTNTYQQSKRFERWLRDDRYELEHEHQDPEQLAKRLIWESVTPGHRPTAPLRAQEITERGQITATQWELHRRQLVQPANAVLVATSPEDPEQLLQRLRPYFEDWQASPGIAPLPPMLAGPAAVGTPRDLWVQHPNAERSVVRWVCPLPPGLTAEQSGVLRHALDAIAFEELTSRTGLSSDTHSSVPLWPDGADTVWISATTSADRAADTANLLRGMNTELQSQLQRRLPEALQTARRYAAVARTRLTRVRTEVYLEGLHGEPHSVVNGVARYDHVELDRIAEYAGQCAAAATVVVTSTAPAPPGFEALPLSEEQP